MNKHTPGPWRVNKFPRKSIMSKELMYRIDGPNLVMDYEISGFTEEDARLIAAAPDLLDALKVCEGNISSLLASQHPKVFCGWLECVSAAIAKATGEQA